MGLIVFFKDIEPYECYNLIRQGVSLYAQCIDNGSVFHISKEYITPTSKAIPIRLNNSEKGTDSIILKENGAEKVVVLFNSKEQNLSCEVILPPKVDILEARLAFEQIETIRNSRIAIVGLGSFGSNIAIELAKCGITQIDLFDFDRLEVGNITRHACGLDDVGRLKVDAVKSRVLNFNPFASVNSYAWDINQNLNDFTSIVQQCNLLICVTDENKSRINCTISAKKTGVTALFGRAITRAEGGDVLRFRPSSSPCISCLSGKGMFNYRNEEIGSLKLSQKNAPDYMDPEDIISRVQVGLTNDIVPLWNMIVKLALNELNPNDSLMINQSTDLEADYYFWVNRRENKYQGLPPMGFSVNKPTILRWYGVKLEKDTYCPICN
jgi:molybdopterin/thiamine biosynthesis adenylyltransferase